MILVLLNFREQPMFTCKAHVFHIDPMTKRSWVPASATAVAVSFFYDSARGLYRIISVEGSKVRNKANAPKLMYFLYPYQWAKYMLVGGWNVKKELSVAFGGFLFSKVLYLLGQSKRSLRETSQLQPVSIPCTWLIKSNLSFCARKARKIEETRLRA